MATPARDAARTLWYDAPYPGGARVTRLTPMTASDEKSSRRRSTRILLRVPLIINVAQESPETDWESVETVTVSQHGGMVRTRQNFTVGDTLEIRIRNGDRTARAHVAWTSSKLTANGFELGFEIIDDDNFWEITFPPDRWSARMRPPREEP